MYAVCVRFTVPPLPPEFDALSFLRLIISINMNIFTIWLVMVVAWNFGYPEATPLEDVIVAIILSLFNIYLKKYLKF